MCTCVGSKINECMLYFWIRTLIFGLQRRASLQYYIALYILVLYTRGSILKIAIYTLRVSNYRNILLRIG